MAHLTHGHTRNRARTSEYQSWRGMKGRCFSPSCNSYQRYGGAGISVCHEWRHSFETFLEAMGLKPSSRHTLDRINPTGNYEPGNCRWATPKEQAMARRAPTKPRPAKVITVDGEALTINEWARKLNVKRMSIDRRISQNWTPERAVSTPFPYSVARPERS